MARIDDLNELLQKLTDAGNELRITTGEAHAARRDLHSAVAAHKAEITTIIGIEVRRQLELIVADIRGDMEELITDEIERIVTDWRKALKLS